MAVITQDYSLKFRKSNGGVETYYGYTSKFTTPSLAFRSSNGNVRYIPLEQGTNGPLRIRYNNTVYSVARQNCTVSIPLELSTSSAGGHNINYPIDGTITINNVFTKTVTINILYSFDGTFDSETGNYTFSPYSNSAYLITSFNAYIGSDTFFYFGIKLTIDNVVIKQNQQKYYFNFPPNDSTSNYTLNITVPLF